MRTMSADLGLIIPDPREVLAWAVASDPHLQADQHLLPCCVADGQDYFPHDRFCISQAMGLAYMSWLACSRRTGR